MVRLRNTNPLGQVDLPLLGLTLDAGEEFDVPPEHVDELLAQSGNYELVEDTPQDTEAAPAAGTEGAA